MTMPAICPDCRVGKHRACNGLALDEATDEITDCECEEHDDQHR